MQKSLKAIPAYHIGWQAIQCWQHRLLETKERQHNGFLAWGKKYCAVCVTYDFHLNHVNNKSISIYKIKVLSVYWFKSRRILIAQVSSKVMNENTLNKIHVCMFGWIPHDSRKNGWRDYYEISYLDEKSSNVRL